MNCGWCHLELLDTHPKCTLLCNHTVHTRCFIVRNMNMGIEHVSCNDCTVAIVTPEISAEVYGHPPISCETIAQASPEFVTSINDLIKLIKNSRKSLNTLNKRVRIIHTEYKEYTKIQKTILKNYIKEKVKQIKELSEYKECVKAKTTLKRAGAKICNVHNVNRYELGAYLLRITNLRPMRYFYRSYNPLCSIKRKFHICIRA